MLSLELELRRFVRQIRPGLIGGNSNPNANLNQVIEEMRLAPHLRTEIEKKFEEFFLSRDFVIALTETGLTLETGVFAEIYRRIEYKFLPKPVETTDILTFLTRVFDARSDAAWLEKINHERFGEFVKMILPARELAVERLAPQFFMSVEILALRLAGFGYDPLVTTRLKEKPELQHSFMDVTRNVHSLLEGKGEEAIPALRESLRRCSEAASYIRAKRSREGISLGLTYRLMKIQQVCRRMELLIELMEAMLGEWRDEPAIELFFEVMLAEIRRFDLRRFLGSNVEMLAFQITEHTGKTGEHYITRTRGEWMSMFRSAAIGGVVVGFMVVLKFLVHELKLAPVPEGFAYGTLYAAGFLLIGAVGGTLATKQPAMTASRLASAMDEASTNTEALANLSEVIVRTIRSQLIAVLGNFLIAFPMAAFLALPFKLAHIPILGHEEAWRVVESFHPYKSLSLIYAAIAGVGLAGAGLFAGFADNWFVFNHVGARLKNSDLLRKRVGPHSLDRVIQSIDHNLGFWVGNIALGYYLGIMGPFGKTVGLPLDIRHITFASGQFGVALSCLDFQVLPSLFLLTSASILLMGLVNLAVSFSITLFLAIKSRRIKFAQTPQLLGMLGKRFRARPSEFFFPTGDAG